jgi:hypothetical protein
MLKYLTLLLMIASSPTSAASEQERDVQSTGLTPGLILPGAPPPRIEPEPRWNPDVVKAYLKEQASRYYPEPKPEPVALPDPIPAPRVLINPAQAPSVWADEPPAIVLSKLGTPTLDRRDGKVRVLQFARASCILDVLMTRRIGAPDFGVRGLTARSKAGATVAPLECLNGQLRARRLPSVSSPTEVVTANPPPTPTAPVDQGPPPTSAPIEVALPPLAAAATPQAPAPAPGLSYPLSSEPPPQ